ncbi:MAG TPA: Holliday junction branch migration protein RuvA [Clostridiales bacterium]|jgi:Holliday junction DNA helicase RuvA|nr:Holliday junction branch migration protein RuvA [Clostridium sp.]CDE55311.1 holliday junction ATP-dependent DNA helicase RuvA [Clostridium sp. CAG:269]HCQ56039.1 Holliday junction branch migration protein RuvA [Clostridiales bacterium]
MFAYIKGSLEMKSSGYIVIDINGLGYKIFMSQNNIDSIGELHNIIKVFTYVKVREDDISIFGFKTQEELKMFELLISVSGVGAKSALVMLSCIEPSDFAIAVISNDVKVLTKVPGIGNKSAQRIILELKDKLKEEQLEEKLKDSSKRLKDNSENINEAISGLMVLGYSKKDIEKAFEHLDIDNLSIEDLIKKGLILLSQK